MVWTDSGAEVTLYQNGGAFYQAQQEFLLANEAACQLLIHNADIQRETPLSQECFFGQVSDGGTALLFGQVSSFPLVICSARKEGLARPAAALAAFLSAGPAAETNAGYIADEAVCGLFHDEWQRRDPDAAQQLKLSTTIMQLDKVQGGTASGNLPSGKSRRASAADLPLLWRFAAGFQGDTGGSDLSEADRERWRSRLEAGNVWLFETSGGEVVSMANICRKLRRGVCISGVYTPPEQRGKGYAGANMRALCERLKAEGCEYLSLFVDRENPVSNHIYRQLGFKEVVNCRQYTAAGRGFGLPPQPQLQLIQRQETGYEV